MIKAKPTPQSIPERLLLFCLADTNRQAANITDEMTGF
jgi:hypothetical protein